MHRLRANLICERARIIPLKMRLHKFFMRGQLTLQPIPILLVVAQIDEERDLLRLNQRNTMLDYRLEQFALRPRASHRDEETTRFIIVHSPEPRGAVRLDILHQLVVNVVPDVVQRVGRHGIHHLARLIETAHHPETVIAGWRLHTVLRALGQLERHRPVIEHHIHHVRHAPRDRAHAVPHVRGEYRHIRGECLVQIFEQFAHFIVFDICFQEAPRPAHNPGVQNRR